MKIIRNPRVGGMQCIRCDRMYHFDDFFEGCPVCLREGWPASLKVRYTEFPRCVTEETLRDWLAYTGPVLGEGRTSVVDLPDLAHELGLAGLLVKNESSNPTGSHKDRMSALIVQRAKEVGASTVAVASSGNAGASVAAYAALAGLQCVVVTMPEMSPNWRRACEMHGARLIATSTPDERWTLVAQKTRSGEWYPATNFMIPPVGSNPMGIDGFRAIALELFLQTKERPATDIVVPTSRGDLMWGVAQGFIDLREAGLIGEIPRVHAAEPFPRISRILMEGDYRNTHDGKTAMVSIGGSTSTYQAVDAIRRTGGSAIPVDEKRALRDQSILARSGLYLELSSAVALSAARSLGAEEDASSRVVVCVGTSHGYKELAIFGEPLQPERVAAD
ncbi:threonine synthase [Neorhizobium galegae]|uniref:threonine synthase n=2 Tax=Neorhizobium galegae TaxID=399 RepID=UPI000621EC12|nr:pyridoxal-phosphate dependent enzyme [Neorhizobium galegae]CDZ64565.1 Threonine synthase [Neorhizobium galegae bv. orientalis]CDZ68092.1 Threonine synthase [Neorhizobium galegae bv. orientalis]CDZ74077.1 Threonine synthase [Neorhizobium galegae bv. orientalis]